MGLEEEKKSGNWKAFSPAVFKERNGLYINYLTVSL